MNAPLYRTEFFPQKKINMRHSAVNPRGFILYKVRPLNQAVFSRKAYMTN